MEREDGELWLHKNHRAESYDNGGGLSEDADRVWSELWLPVWMGGWGHESTTRPNHYITTAVQIWSDDDGALTE